MKGKLGILGFCGLFILVSTFAHARIKGDTVYYDATFNAPLMTRSEYYKGYNHIETKGAQSFGNVGEPVLPVKGLKILIPPNTKVKSIEVIPSEKVVFPGSYAIEPGQRQYPLSKIGKIKVKLDEPNRKIYQSNSPYYKQLYTALTLQKKMGYSIAMIDLYPVEYNPKTGAIAYYKTLRLAVQYEPESKVSASQEKTTPQLRSKRGIMERDIKRISRLIDNKEDLSVYNHELTARASRKAVPMSAALNPKQQYDYVIITHPDFVSSLQPLKERRIQKGLIATIVTTDWIYANYPGTRPDGTTDNQTKIRNFITDAYNNWGTEYVLLAGDGDGADVGGESGNTIIPPRGLSDSSQWMKDNNIPADLYYSCLDGSFDKNANGIYGEKTDGETDGEIDLLAEVYVGRICVDSVAEANNFVKKTLAYEDSNNVQLINKNYMVGERLGFGGVSEYATANMDEIRLGTNAHDYETAGFMSNPDMALNVDTLYDSERSEWPKSQLIDIMNNGVHILNHLGHANVDYDMKLYNNDVDALTNTDYFIGYSQGCYPGSFDNRTTDANSYSSSDCIAEHLTGNATGAVAFVGNSRYGWGAFNSTAGSSQYYDRQFWDALFGEGIVQIGRMNQDSKEDNIPYLYANQNRWVYFELNLFGDPALEVHTANTAILALSNFNIIEQIADGLFHPGETGKAIATVKALNNDVVNASITLSSADPYVKIEQNYVSYPIITKGVTQDNTTNPFTFTISKECPVGHAIHFTLKVKAEGYAKEQALSIYVYDAKLQRIVKETANYNPAISGNKIVWVDSRNGSNDVYLYDLSTNTERRITSLASNYRYDSDISEDKIVWYEYRDGIYDIYLYDLSTSTERRITDGQGSAFNPAISGENMVWVDSRTGSYDVYLYDLTTNTGRRITTSTASQYAWYPAISGNKIVWFQTDSGGSDIYLYDLTNNTERRITAGQGKAYYPAISDEKIIWVDLRNGSKDVYLYNLATNTERMIAKGRGEVFSLAISGDKIVWIDSNNGNTDIKLYDLSTETEQQITSVAGTNSVDISEDKIVFKASGDIFLYDLQLKNNL